MLIISYRAYPITESDVYIYIYMFIYLLGNYTFTTGATTTGVAGLRPTCIKSSNNIYNVTSKKFSNTAMLWLRKSVRKPVFILDELEPEVALRREISHKSQAEKTCFVPVRLMFMSMTNS